MCQGCYHHQMVTSSHAPSMKHYYGGSGLTRQRSTDPEIFTFDTVPMVKSTPAANPRLRSKRRAVKVLYPAQVRKYLPPEKKDWAKRMLLLFLCVLVVQVYAATEMNEEATTVAVATAPGGLQANLSREWAMGVSPASEVPFIPNSGRVSPALPKLPASGADGINPAVVNPLLAAPCHRMRSGSTACRM
ncbi:radiation-inducible immediate-early gene IEX-1-like [Mustelus asterias]